MFVVGLMFCFVYQLPDYKAGLSRVLSTYPLTPPQPTTRPFSVLAAYELKCTVGQIKCVSLNCCRSESVSLSVCIWHLNK